MADITITSQPKFQVGDLLIPAPNGVMQFADGKAVIDIQEQNGVYYYKLDDPTTTAYWPEHQLIQPQGKAQAATAITPLAAAVLRKMIDCQSVDGYIDALPEPWLEIARNLEATPPNPTQRTQALEAGIACLPDRAAIQAAVFAADRNADLAALAQQSEVEQEKPPADRLPDDTPIQFTDYGNARRFAKQHGDQVRYTQERGWLIWDGKRWAEDKTGAVMRLAKQTVKGLFREAEKAEDQAKAAIRAVETAQEQGDDQAMKAARERREAAQKWANKLVAFALQSQMRARLDAMLYLGQSEIPIAARVDDFDCDPWLLNVQNGILDLRTGRLSAHDPKALMSKIAGAYYYPDAKCPTWLKFLERIFDNNEEMISFIRRAAGYSLTGNIGEQCLFFLHGTGANGKSTFTGAIQDVLGDYGMKTRAETLMVRKQDAIPEEIAQLAGVRFMLAAELGGGQRLNESLIKDLTGGDRLRARLLHRNSFEFSPQAKPWLYGNHRPIIKGTDDGIWRRPHLIPFTVTIPEHERDKKLPEKLRAELAGILAWAVAGCLEWQRDGLKPPKEVIAATAEYRAEQDIIAAFMGDCCIMNSLTDTPAGDMYKAYKEWAKDSGLDPISQIAFSRQMTERGLNVSGRGIGGKAYYRGMGLSDTGRDFLQRAKTQNQSASSANRP